MGLQGSGVALDQTEPRCSPDLLGALCQGSVRPATSPSAAPPRPRSMRWQWRSTGRKVGSIRGCSYRKPRGFPSWGAVQHGTRSAARALLKSWPELKVFLAPQETVILAGQRQATYRTVAGNEDMDAYGQQRAGGLGQQTGSVSFPPGQGAKWPVR